VPKRVFGHIPGYPEGSRFESRAELSEAGVHRPTMAGISGSESEGADSIVLSGGYEDDEDLGEEIVYTGHGGRDVERAGTRGDPDREANMWLEKLYEVEQERRGYLRLAAKGHMTDDDLAEALAELKDTRVTAETELRAIRGRKASLEELERHRDALLES
jgi:hypothetical protein